MSSFLRQMLAEHSWLKQLSEIVLLICAAGLLGWITRRWLRRWAGRFDRAFNHSLILVLGRAMPPLLMLVVITLSFHLFPLSVKAMAVIDRIFYVAVLAVILYCASKLARLFLNRWL